MVVVRTITSWYWPTETFDGVVVSAHLSLGAPVDPA
jgi:hypothetical protein